MPYGSNFPSLNFRTTGAWGAGNGLGTAGRLTNVQADENIDELGRAVEALRDNPPTADSISNITSTSASFTIHLVSGATFGPFTLPVARFAWRGEWAAATPYLTNDWFKVTGVGIFAVLQDHTSAATFDAAAADSDGAIYQIMLGPDVPPASTVTASAVTLGLADPNTYKRFTTIPCTVTFPRNETSAIPVHSQGMFRQAAGDSDGSGVSMVGETTSDGAVTINGKLGAFEETDGLGAVVYWKKVGANEFDIWGDLRSGSA